jgi:hypothetical protein
MKIIPGKPLPAQLEAEMEEIESMQAVIKVKTAWIESLEGDKKLEEARKKVIDIINELGIENEVNELMEQKRTLQEKVIEIGKKVEQETWGPDAFSKGKKDAVYNKTGTIGLLRSKRTVRTIIPKKFVDTYPLLANKYVEEGKIKIPINVAEQNLGKEDINQICSTETTYSYELKVKGSGETYGKELKGSTKSTGRKDIPKTRKNVISPIQEQ